MREIRAGFRAANLFGSDLEEENIGVLIAMATFVGQDPDTLARATGFDRGWVERVRKRLVDGGCWVDGKFAFDWAPDTDAFTVEFVLHVLVGQGTVVRVP
jgi:hypothetical protein